MQLLGIAIDRLGTASRLIVGLIALATIGVVAYIVMSAGGAAYTPAFTNLDARSAGEVQAALAGAGIPTKLGEGGATVMVPSAKINEARVVAGKAGVGGSRADWSLLDESSLSMTDGQFHYKVQRVRSDVLAAQIESIVGVRHATVNLAIPERSIFSADQEQVTASINIDTGGGALTDTAVRGIISLVSNGVPGLVPQNVSVVDEQGRPLASATTAIGLASADRMTAEATWEAMQSAKAQAMLDRMLGPGKGSVVVAGELNFDEVTTSTQAFGDDKGAIQSAIEKENLTQKGGATGGTPSGTAGNIPGAATAGGSSESTYSHDQTTATNAIDTTATETKSVGGTPTRMTVSVVVDKKALEAIGGTAPEQVVADAIANSVGLDTTDAANKISVSAIDKLPNPVDALKKAGIPLVATGGASSADGSALGGLIPAPFGGLLQPLGAGVGLLVMLFLVRKSLARRQALLGGTDSSWLPALEAPPIKIDDLMPALGAPTAGELNAAEKKALQGRVEEIAQTRPSDVAAQMRGWLTAEA